MLRNAFCLKPLLFTILLTANISFADNLMFDRGLPTTHLNNAAGADRSNVAWAFPGGQYVVGDSFSFGTAGESYTINTLRLWIVEGNATPGVSSLPFTTSMTLYGGPTGNASATTSLPTTWTATPVTYAGGQDYQGSSGGMLQLWQIDFANLNWNVVGGNSYSFYLGGTGTTNGGPFLSASNAGLSGSTQQGADDSMYYYNPIDGDLGTWSSAGNGWDKASDINVQIFTTPEPGSCVELAAGFIGVCLFVVRRRRIGQD